MDSRSPIIRPVVLIVVLATVALSWLSAPGASAQSASPQAGTPTADCPTLSEEETAEVAQQYLNVWNTQDLSTFDTLAHPDVIHHWGQGPDTVGIDALKASTTAFFAAFPDMEMTFDLVLTDGDYVTILWTLTGTQTGPFFELEPTGVQATWSGINIYRVECGQVVESWSEADAIGLRAQLNGAEATPTSAS